MNKDLVKTWKIWTEIFNHGTMDLRSQTGLEDFEELEKSKYASKSSRQLMQRAKIFAMPAAPEGYPAIHPSPELLDTFIFPFDTVAVMYEDRNTIVCIQKTSEGVGFIGNYRVFILCAQNVEGWVDPEVTEYLENNLESKMAFYVEFGATLNAVGHQRMNNLGFLTAACIKHVVTKKYKAFWLSSKGNEKNLDYKKTQDLVSDYCMAAINAMFLIQDPKHFIVELAPEHKPFTNSHRNKKPLSLNNKPIYISLLPKEIRRRCGIDDPSGIKKQAHERRAHLRRLTADRFGANKGKIIPVKACWVGPSSGKTPEGREYKIILN